MKLNNEIWTMCLKQLRNLWTITLDTIIALPALIQLVYYSCFLYTSCGVVTTRKLNIIYISKLTNVLVRNEYRRIIRGN